VRSTLAIPVVLVEDGERDGGSLTRAKNPSKCRREAIKPASDRALE
jgi:hypothetical protein